MAIRITLTVLVPVLLSAAGCAEPDTLVGKFRYGQGFSANYGHLLSRSDGSEQLYIGYRTGPSCDDVSYFRNHITLRACGGAILEQRAYDVVDGLSEAECGSDGLLGEAYDNTLAQPGFFGGSIPGEDFGVEGVAGLADPPVIVTLDAVLVTNEPYHRIEGFVELVDCRL